MAPKRGRPPALAKGKTPKQTQLTLSRVLRLQALFRRNSCPLLHQPPPRHAAARRPTPPKTARRPRLMVLLYAMPGGLGLGRALGSGRASAGKRSQPAQSAVRAASCRGLQPNFPLGARARARYGPRQPLPDPARSTADRELFSPMRSAATMAQMWCSIYL